MSDSQFWSDLRLVSARDRKKGTGSRPRTAPGISGNTQVGRVPCMSKTRGECVEKAGPSSANAKPKDRFFNTVAVPFFRALNPCVKRSNARIRGTRVADPPSSSLDCGQGFAVVKISRDEDGARNVFLVDVELLEQGGED